MASTMANIVSMLIEKPSEAEHAERAEDDHRHGDGRDQRGPQVAEEEVHDQEDEEDRLDERLEDLVDGHPHEGRRVVG